MQPLLRLRKSRTCYEATRVAKSRTAILIVFVIIGFGCAVAGQTTDQVPVPEYYGVYALIKGKLFGIGVPRSTITPEENEIRVGQHSTAGEVIKGSPPVHTAATKTKLFPSDVQFLVFSDSSGGLFTPMMVAKELRVERLTFVRNATVDTGWPNAVKRTAPEQAWDTGMTPEMSGIARAVGAADRPLTRRLQLLVKPIKGQSSIAIAVPAEPLAPGLYLLSGEHFPGMEFRSLLFGVQPLADAEKSTCVDVTYTYAMQMANATATRCAESSAASQPVPSPQSQGPSTFGAAPKQPEPNGPSEPQAASFQVRHRHSTFFNLQNSSAQSSCSGILSVSPDGTVKYDCNQTQDPSGRCDHLSFSPGSLDQVKIGLNGLLHIASKTQGKSDFYGEPNSIKQAYSLITSGAHQTSTSTASTTSTSPPGPLQPGVPSGCAVFRNSVVPNACIGEFRHGTQVFEDSDKNLSLATATHPANLTHAGVDLVAPCDTSPIYSVADGVVEAVIDSPSDPNWGVPGKTGLGYLVLVHHAQPSGGKPTYSIYLHMSKPPMVGRGTNVLAGKTVLGLVGQTGAAWGCHTHFEIRHFGTLLLDDPQWHHPPNIYGAGDQRTSDVFLQNWEDPLPFLISARSATH